MTEEKETKQEPSPDTSGKKGKSARTKDTAGETSPVGADVASALKTVMKLSTEDRKSFIAEYVGGLSVLELNDQVKALEEAFGVSAAPAAMMMAAAAPAAETPAETEKASFDVVLKEVADKTKRVQVIKTVRDVLSVALKEAKALVDGAPGKVKEGASKEEAEKIKTELEAAGATVELR